MPQWSEDLRSFRQRSHHPHETCVCHWL